MMDTKQAYNTWAPQYDTDKNKTRDLEARALRETLANHPFGSCLEIGCGTGKNTAWLMERGGLRVTAVDFSDEMLARAKEKVTSRGVEFRQGDITAPWTFREGRYDLVTFSLVLEHIRDLDHIFRETAVSLNNGGYIYIGELHPFKQYTGTKARFDTEEGRQVPECFTHHLSDFVLAAKKYGLELRDMNEYFDTGDRSGIPRILTLFLMKW